MKTVKTFLLAIISLSLQSQNLIGAWEWNHHSEDGTALKSVVILTEGHQVIATHNAENGAFISTNGGTWSIDGNTVTEVVEFDTKNPDRVGSTVTFDIETTETTIQVVDSDMLLTRIDDGSPGSLQGAWLISGRVRDGELRMRDTDRPRKTMKILSGTRFQWIAYNTETKEFMGTGGGSYTTVDGKYTENIEFFSRDDTRVGASLGFDFELIDGNWHHKGLSSKGNPIHEVWSVRK